ncbi:MULTISPECIES: hypothetical protein [Streptosporangium]|uniref:Lipoprotein n=1 Tax=Streptosporangium brasiliense TaxID=47480 RepID=A0ABT9RMB8_9ACTN|nr:hypothetical protein [Streptosporangium brasiliense]MDP9870432.1 hypothetical protein [Streptosporangium brasiliense]
MRSHTLFLVAGSVAAALLLTGCSEFNQKNGRGDTPIGKVDNSGAEIINMPDTFGNLATKCSHGFRVWSTTHGSSDDKTEYASQIWVERDSKCPQDGVQ